MTVTISREYSFSAAHRLEGHPQCGRMHGHNYAVEVIVEASIFELSPNGMILDYHDLDEIVKPIVALLDHRYLVSDANARAGDVYYKAVPRDCYLMDVEQTTAELIAGWFFAKLEVHYRLKHYGIVVIISETPKSKAAYAAD